MQFSIGGFAVNVHPLFWLTAFVFGYMQYGGGPTQWAVALWIPIMFLAILLHELGHAVAFRRYGIQSEIRLVAFGGETVPLTPRRLRPGEQFVVSFAGPLVGILIGGAALALERSGQMPVSEPVALAVDAIVWTNLGWAIFNLLPIVGMDGGNMMSAVFEKLGGPRGVRLALLLSVVVACAIATFAFANGLIFMGFIIGLLGWRNYVRWRMSGQWQDRIQPIRPQPTSAAPRGEAVDVRPIDADLTRAWEALEKGNPLTVRMIAEPLVPRARTEDERFQVAHLVAWGRLLSGDARGAEIALGRLMPTSRRPDALLEGALLLERQRFADAATALTEALVGRSDDFVAVRLAKAVGESGRIDGLVAHLGEPARATEIGSRPFQVVVGDLMQRGRWAEAARLGEALFGRFGIASDAFNVACALGREGKGEEALGWLDRALEKGLSDPSLVLTDADLASVRALPGFEALRERVQPKAG